MMIRRIGTLSAVLTAAFALSACEEKGVPSADGDPTLPPATGQSTAPSTGGAANPLEGKVACEFVTDADVADIKAGYELTKKADDRLGPNDCEWQARAGDAELVTFGLTIRPTEGLDAVVVQDGWTAVDGKVDNVRAAKQLKQDREVSESCVIAMEAGPTSRVDVQGNGDKGPACEIVSALASIVHEKLVKEGL